MFLPVAKGKLPKQLDRETVRAVGGVPGRVKDKRPEPFRATVTKKTPMPESRRKAAEHLRWKLPSQPWIL